MPADKANKTGKEGMVHWGWEIRLTRFPTGGSPTVLGGAKTSEAAY